MIIGGILTFFIAILFFIVGFAQGYGIGYLDKQDDEKEKTGDVHEQRGENFTMEKIVLGLIALTILAFKL